MALKKKSAQNVCNDAYAAFGLAILRRSMETRKPKDNAIFREERSKGMIIKFFPVITLNTLDR
jgi:hypothetical protein